MEVIAGLVMFGLLIFFLFKPKKLKAKYKGPIPAEWRKILIEKVSFYGSLALDERSDFEKRIQHFLNTTRITGIKTNVTLTDELLVASSAIIPVFAFPEWEYANLNEVLLYSGSFNEGFETKTENSRILGMVGSGYMNGKMILSKPSLHKGFQIGNDKKNVGIHEFTHLIDKADGVIDGIPEALIDKQFVIPWMDLIRKNMEEIHAQNSDINAYGGVSVEEFFPVITEYFFERPKLLSRKHPELYAQLSAIFSTKLEKMYGISTTKREIGRNDPCPCGSGEKFKKCCGKVA